MPLLERAFAHTALVMLVSTACCADASAQQAVEFFPGPVVSSNKIISMGGAYTGIALGADAHLINPAAFAQRQKPRRASWFTGDWTLSWFQDAPNTEADASQTPRGSFHADLGFHLNFGRFGIGVHGYSQDFGISYAEGTPNTSLDVASSYGGLGLGWSFWRDQLTVGVLVSTASLDVTQTIEHEDGNAVQSFGSEGQGAMFGLHLKLDDKPWQVGVRARREIRGFELEIEPGMEEMARRGQIVIPKQVSLGFATEVPLERFGRPMMLATDLVLTGKTEGGATTLQGFVLQNGEVTGEQTTLAPHIGAQLEVLPDRLRLRGGGYWEPDRARARIGRPHVTLGGEVKVNVLWDWRVDTCVDIAPGYFNWGLGVGFWTPSPAPLTASPAEPAGSS